MQDKPKLLIAESEGFSTKALAMLATTFEVDLCDLGRAQLLERLAPYEFLWVRLRNMIDAEILGVAPRLRAVATNTTGLNHIDLEAADRLGISIVSLRGEVEFLREIRATAEHTIGLCLAHLRKIPEAHTHCMNGGWDRNQFRGREIYRSTVGIIGYGRLGSITASYFKALGASVVVHSAGLLNGDAVDGFPTVSLDQVFEQCDIVSLHINYVPENDQMIGERQFRKAKPNCLFVNTARGELVDQQALIHALEEGWIAGAALDVLANEQETQTVDPRLLELPPHKLVITPHIGGNTVESLVGTEVFLAHKLIAFVR